MKNFYALLLTVACLMAAGRELSAQSTPDPAGNPASPLSLTGYSRATGFMGIIKDVDPALRSLYSETALRLKARTGKWGQAFSDIRFRTGTEFGAGFSTLDIREAYIDLFLGKVDFRIGKQISPWGRADGWNPTDNLTPADYFVRSPDHDDIRTGSYRIRGQYNPFTWMKLEADLVPWYTPSVYRFDLVEMPSFVSISAPVHPGFQWDKTSIAGKIDLIFPAIEGSLSWFNGYDPMPALQPGRLPQPPFTDFSMQLLQVPFRQQTYGADLATVVLNTGLRGEIAWKVPDKSDSTAVYVPNSDITWVVSLDRELGPFRLIAGYMGKYVQNFVPADPPQAFDPAILTNPEYWPMLGTMLNSQIGYYNRILFDQTHKSSHTLLLRPSVTLFHEALDLEVSGMYNLTTAEYLIYPKITWHVTDGLLATAGYQYYEGDPYTRFSWIKNIFNGPFFEFRLTF